MFSLRDIEALEHERADAEEQARQSAQRAARAARHEADRVARDAETRRIEEELRRISEAERARRDEAARHAAMERAEVERVLAEAAARARAEQAQVERVHAVELARATALADRGRYRFLLAASVITTLVVAGFAAFVSTRVSTLTAEAAGHAAAAVAAQAEYERSARLLEETTRRIRSLEHELASARAFAAGREQRETTPIPAGLPRRPSSRPGSGRGPGPALGTVDCGADGDPLNGCLRR